MRFGNFGGSFGIDECFRCQGSTWVVPYMRLPFGTFTWEHTNRTLKKEPETRKRTPERPQFRELPTLQWTAPNLLGHEKTIEDLFLKGCGATSSP